MLSIKSPKGFFNIRVAGVIQRDSEILLLNEALVGEYWFLPGGRAEMHESTDETLVRELEEEMNAQARIKKLLWIIENFYTISEKPSHTIGFYYSVEIPKNHPLAIQEEYFTERQEDGVVKKFHFRWCSLDEISHMDIRPPCLKKMLQEMHSHSQLDHFVIRENASLL